MRNSYLQRILNDMAKVNFESPETFYGKKETHNFYSQIKDYEMRLRDALKENFKGHVLRTLMIATCGEYPHREFFQELFKIHNDKFEENKKR